MKSLKRGVASVLAVLFMSGSALSATGCGATGHFVAGVAAHHVINHFVHTQAGRKRVDKVFCLYHGHRVLVDLRTHHVFTAGLNAIAAYHSCKAGFSRTK